MTLELSFIVSTVHLLQRSVRVMLLHASEVTTQNLTILSSRYMCLCRGRTKERWEVQGPLGSGSAIHRIGKWPSYRLSLPGRRG